jgi:hypothetical protein
MFFASFFQTGFFLCIHLFVFHWASCFEKRGIATKRSRNQYNDSWPSPPLTDILDQLASPIPRWICTVHMSCCVLGSRVHLAGPASRPWCHVVLSNKPGSVQGINNKFVIDPLVSNKVSQSYQKLIL